MATRFHDCFAFVERIPGGTAEVVYGVRSNTETSQLLRLNNFESDPGFGSVTIELECLSVYQLLEPRPNKPAQRDRLKNESIGPRLTDRLSRESRHSTRHGRRPST